MRLHPKTLLTLFLALPLWGWPASCHSVEHSYQDQAQALDRLAWWREAKFGLFVHWGLYSIPAGKWNGRDEYGEWIRANAQIPLQEYEQLREHWNPRRFDADLWARAARDAGMKYMVVTTKHHDGFALFDSKVTEWDVMSTPARQDVMAEVARACREQGIVPGWYYSIMDWHHPDYLPRRAWEVDRSAEGADYDRYEQYLTAQVTELLTHYGPIGVMWFDGDWEATWTGARGARLYDLCRRLQPNVIVNNRLGPGHAVLNRPPDTPPGLGDFVTPEQQIPESGSNSIDWESCLTMNDNWGFTNRDMSFKPTRQLLETLVEVASKGGNLLLNVGPTADGEIPSECLERLADIGRWMKVNGVAIHGARSSPIDPPAFGRVTWRMENGDTRLYLHVIDWPADGRLTFEGLGNEALSARLLADPTRKIEVDSTPGRVTLRVDGGATDANISVIEVVLSGEPILYTAPNIETESDLFLDETLVTVAAPSRALVARYTLDGSEPTAASALANGPIRVANSVVIRARTFHEGRPVAEVAQRSLERSTPSPAQVVAPDSPGLVRRIGRGVGEHLDSAWMMDAASVVVTAFEAPPEKERAYCSYEGFVRVEHTDVYRIKLRSEDGSRLAIDGKLVCETDGRGAKAEVFGLVALEAGWHRLRVEALSGKHSSALQAWIGRSGSSLTRLAAKDLAHLSSDR
ncbi:MAG: alpha-L-fucosidase [Planctomycetes bacterium]|nr:alpha-L-fucosidase [Planctomycetota bacterium]